VKEIFKRYGIGHFINEPNNPTDFAITRFDEMEEPNVDEIYKHTFYEILWTEKGKSKQTIDYIEHVSQLGIAENKFQQMFAENKPKAYKTFLSAESILNRNGYLPAINSSDQHLLIDSTPISVQYKMNGIGSSLKEDMGYIYGTTTINGKAENFLRIWRRERNGWKIALEVLRY